MKQFLIAIDQALNTVIKIGDDGYGYADEMLSARVWRLRKQSNLYIWIDTLFFWDKNHCEECYAIEMERQQLPTEYRQSKPANEC